MKHHIVPVYKYLIIITALLALTILTVTVAKHDFGIFNNIIAFAIAFTKMMLVVMFFMHLKYSPKILWLCAGAAFVWLVIMMTITLTDYNSRAWLGLPQPWEKVPVVLTAPPHAAHEK